MHYHQCEYIFRSENGLKIHVGKAHKFLSLWETIWIEWDSKRANKGIIIIVKISIIKLCACWQCAIIMSAFCHWIGISAEWPTTTTTTYHRELRTPINVSAQCSMHDTKNYVRSFSKTYTLLPELETLRSHAVFTPMRISWPGIAISKRSGPHVSQKWKARVCTKMKSKRTMKYHEKPRHYFMAVAALINQGFKTCFLVFQLCLFASVEDRTSTCWCKETIFEQQCTLSPK